jgi:acyl carrier protein
MMAEVWGEVLRVERVGIHDDFFELGGHSLLATRLISRIREVFRVELPLLSLFHTPNIAALSEEITERQGKEEGGNQIGDILQEIIGLSADELQLAIALETR